MTIGYWDTVGATKTFTHPLNLRWLDGVARDAQILDYGCGYGRTMAQLSDAGFTEVTGADVSAALLARGRSARPDLRSHHIEKPPHVPVAAAAVDVVILFAVLTCVPDDADQAALIGEIARVLRPDGLLYVSDLLRDGTSKRYAANGVFTTTDGAVCRHHELADLRNRLAGFALLRAEEIAVTTMNGHPARGVQLMGRRDASAGTL
jgi:SAM-dependent methyltransferase